MSRVSVIGRVREAAARVAGFFSGADGGDPVPRWLAVITVAALAARLWLAIGYALGDDGGYADWINNILHGLHPEPRGVGQYEYRPAWLYPLAASVGWLGWTPLGLALYPAITGALIPLFSALWLRSHLPARHPAPAICAAILAFAYPTMFVDSLMLVNEIPMVCWGLLCVVLTGATLRRLADGGRAWFACAIGAGVAMTAAYQVKSSAIPTVGLWLVAELGLFLAAGGGTIFVRARARVVAACGLFLVPVAAAQTYYLWRTGHWLGNLRGEVRYYEQWLPASALEGTYEPGLIMGEYVRALFLPAGFEGYRHFLHGLWPWACVAGLAVWLFSRRKGPETAPLIALVLATASLYLFFQYWPARMFPCYVPNCFTGRPWRYMDVLAPTVAACAALLISVRATGAEAWARGVAAVVAFAVAGHSLALRFHEMSDRGADFRRAAGTISIPPGAIQFSDADALVALKITQGYPAGAIYRDASASGVDVRKIPVAYLWTGGARREGLGASVGWDVRSLVVYGGHAELIETWAAPARPWRAQPLQLWRVSGAAGEEGERHE